MINLIPNQDKKQMAKDFYRRLLVVFLVALAVSFFIGFVALLPAYFFSTVQKEIANNKLKEQIEVPLPQFNQDTLSVVQDLNDKMNLLSLANKDKFVATKRIINDIVSNKTPEVKINQISFSRESLEGGVVSIRGSAPSRDSLLSFRFMLEKNKNFRNVDLPISNFIKDSNIQFFLTLNPVIKSE